MSKLTQEEKRIRLAKACGWSKFGWAILLFGTFTKGGKCWEQKEVPDYYGSLDAVHEAEKRFAELNPDFWDIYLDPGIGTLPDVVGDSCPVECATAAQRAEALGLALGLWKEGE